MQRGGGGGGGGSLFSFPTKQLFLFCVQRSVGFRNAVYEVLQRLVLLEA